MAFICRWKGCWGLRPWRQGLRARQIAIGRSIVTPSICPGREFLVSLDWLVALVWVMGQKKVVIVLCRWACVAVLLSFKNVSRCLLSSSKKSPRHRWSSYCFLNNKYKGRKLKHTKKKIIASLDLYLCRCRLCSPPSHHPCHWQIKAIISRHCRCLPCLGDLCTLELPMLEIFWRQKVQYIWLENLRYQDSLVKF